MSRISAVTGSSGNWNAERLRLSEHTIKMADKIDDMLPSGSAMIPRASGTIEFLYNAEHGKGLSFGVSDRGLSCLLELSGERHFFYIAENNIRKVSEIAKLFLSQDTDKLKEIALSLKN